MKTKWLRLKTLVDNMEGDVNKFSDKGIKASGRRARLSLQEVKKVAQELRIEIQEKVRG